MTFPVGVTVSPMQATLTLPMDRTPEQDDVLLCEGCGYTLSGLPSGGNCPECGKPIAETLAAGREPTAWEVRPTFGTLMRTAFAAGLRPRRFFRTLGVAVTPEQRRRAWWFGVMNLVVAAVGFASVGEVHSRMLGLTYFDAPLHFLGGPYMAWVAFFGLAAAGMVLGKELAARATAFEARQRGLRLPLTRVRRCLAYQSVGLVAVAAIVFTYVNAYAHLVTSGLVGGQTIELYIYGLAALVPLAGVYLFLTYWAAMRGVMYASR